MNAKNDDSSTSPDFSILLDNKETTDLLRKHGGKTGEELKAERKWCLSKNPVKLRLASNRDTNFSQKSANVF